MVPCVLLSDITHTPKLTPGMTLAIEVIYAQGSAQTQKGKDDWTLETIDKKLAGLFEETILISPKGPKILTKSL